MDGVWPLFAFAVGWIFAPVIAMIGVLIWGAFFPPIKGFEFEWPRGPEPPPPPPPLTDSQFRDLMTKARLLRQRLKRGLVE